MRAVIKKDGFIHVVAETYTEALALEAIRLRNNNPAVLDGSILNEDYDRGGQRNENNEGDLVDNS